MTGHILTPYPGTKLYEKLDKQGRIIDRQWGHYNTAHVVYSPARMTKEQLYEGYIGLYRDFYSYKNILKRIPKNKKQIMPYLLFNFGYRKFGKATSMLRKVGLMRTVGSMASRLAYGI
jgi:radical SAM superfamily enzyme YgiQ (UPF0313 family)